MLNVGTKMFSDTTELFRALEESDIPGFWEAFRVARLPDFDLESFYLTPLFETLVTCYRKEFATEAKRYSNHWFHAADEDYLEVLALKITSDSAFRPVETCVFEDDLDFDRPVYLLECAEYMLAEDPRSLPAWLKEKADMVYDKILAEDDFLPSQERIYSELLDTWCSDDLSRYYEVIGKVSETDVVGLTRPELVDKMRTAIFGCSSVNYPAYKDIFIGTFRRIIRKHIVDGVFGFLGFNRTNEEYLHILEPVFAAEDSVYLLDSLIDKESYMNWREGLDDEGFMREIIESTVDEMFEYNKSFTAALNSSYREGFRNSFYFSI